jgi:hypothetical protein
MYRIEFEMRDPVYPFLVLSLDSDLRVAQTSSARLPKQSIRVACIDAAAAMDAYGISKYPRVIIQTILYVAGGYLGFVPL